FTDGEELVLLLKGKGGREPHIISKDQIQRISFSRKESTLAKLLHKKTRQITVIVKGLGTITYDENKHKAFFESYLTSLRDFCKSNHVTFYDLKG
ncbi:MAG: hypothetical protein J5859_04485, partial [Clostridia bacterium]|nr:hypothetical protein [Clostridia bacterium]